MANTDVTNTDPRIVDTIFTRAVGAVQRSLSHSRLAVAASVKLRNQCDNVIRYYLGEDWHLERNGESLLADSVGTTSSTFVDVGANVGDWAQQFLSGAGQGKRGVLIDASTLAVARLRERFVGCSNIRIVHAAASDSPGEMEFYEEPDAGMTSSLVGSFSKPGARKTRVPVTTVDHEVAEAGLKYVDILKVDAEGYDYHVLRGAGKLIGAEQIGLIQFEYNRPWADAGSTLARAISFLEASRYTVFLLRSTGLHRFNYGYFGECFEYANFVAVSKTKLPDIRSLVRD